MTVAVLRSKRAAEGFHLSSEIVAFRSWMTSGRTEADLVIAGTLAVVVAVLGIVGAVSVEVLSATILALLALWVSLFWRIRGTIASVSANADKQAELLAELVAAARGRTSPAEFFRFDYPDMSSDIEQASEILVIATGSLRTSVGSYFRQFMAAADAGSTIRLVCPDPRNSGLMSEIAETQRESPRTVAENVKSSLAYAERLRSRGGAVEVRVSSWVPSHGLVRLTSPTDGQLLVKLIPFGDVSRPAPVVSLRPERDGSLYAVLSGAGDEAFRASKPWS